VTLPGTRVTESDCGEPEDDLSELVRPGYNTIHPSRFLLINEFFENLTGFISYYL
jgi:hypothetical protein